MYNLRVHILFFWDFIMNIKRYIYQCFKTLLGLKKSIEYFSLLSEAQVEVRHKGNSLSIQHWD